jgi:hypothetical protein
MTTDCAGFVAKVRGACSTRRSATLERIYAMRPLLEHILAGMQYVPGDLKADDTPVRR